MSSNLIGQGFVELNNGYKRLAVVDRGLFLEFEKKLKLFSWSYNAAVGHSRLQFNQRIESLSTDSYVSASFLHLRPLGLKKYFRVGRRSSHYIELLVGVDYLLKHSRNFERDDLPEEKLKNLGFSVAGSAKTGFKVEFNAGRNAFDIGLNGTTDFYSKMYTDKVKKNEKFQMERLSLFITFYQSLKHEKKPPRNFDSLQ